MTGPFDREASSNGSPLATRRPTSGVHRRYSRRLSFVLTPDLTGTVVFNIEDVLSGTVFQTHCAFVPDDGGVLELGSPAVMGFPVLSA